MRIEHITTDLGFDMQLEAILARAEQLTRQEGTALVETKTMIYSLQKKVGYIYKKQQQKKHLAVAGIRLTVTEECRLYCLHTFS